MILKKNFDYISKIVNFGKVDFMRALVTGASSGIGRDIARFMARKGYDLVLVARDIEKMEELKNSIENVNVQIVQMDLSDNENCKKLYNEFGNKVDILVNNAGFGVCGKFEETNLDKEIKLINTNITAVHVLTKLFLQDMKRRNDGYILNVASIAGFMPGPLMSAYYASKSYVVRLSESIREELRRDKSNVKISILCPEPVNTNFNNVANVKFNSKALSSEYVAKYAIEKLLKNKFYIVPGNQIRVLRKISKLVPDCVLARFAYEVQEKKL